MKKDFIALFPLAGMTLFRFKGYDLSLHVLETPLKSYSNVANNRGRKRKNGMKPHGWFRLPLFRPSQQLFECIKMLGKGFPSCLGGAV
jgi:hypothetical protein